MANVVDIAKKEIGYKESANNDNKYGVWYGLNNVSWCAIFVSWVFNQAGLADKVSAQTKKGFASCDAGLKWFTKNNKLVPVGQAQAGDIVFFQFDADAQPDHVGIVAMNNGRILTTIEGNTGTASQSNGDGVYQKVRPYKLVMAVARP